MSQEKKISVRTPSEVYIKLIQRAYELDLNHREYYLALAMKDLELVGKGQTIDKKEAQKIKQLIKDMDTSD